MVTERFDQLFGRLVAAFMRHRDEPRTPDNIPGLGAACWELHLARAAIARERRLIAERAAAQEGGILRRTSVSDDDVARLRVFGTGYVGG